MVQALKSFPRVATFLRRATNRILHQPELTLPSITIGSDYGSHTVPEAVLDQKSIVYSFGIGTDVSFDLGVIKKYGCNVYAFDPTPRSLEWVNSNKFDERFVFSAVGVDEMDGEVIFDFPTKVQNVSFSRGDSTRPGVSLPVKRLGSIMAGLNHPHLTVLKLDVEGFEYKVLPDMLATKIYPDVIAVEFHHRMYGFSDGDTLQAVHALRSSGFKLFHVSQTGREYSFIKR